MQHWPACEFPRALCSCRYGYDGTCRQMRPEAQRNEAAHNPWWGKDPQVTSGRGACGAQRYYYCTVEVLEVGRTADEFTYTVSRRTASGRGSGVLDATGA